MDMCTYWKPQSNRQSNTIDATAGECWHRHVYKVHFTIYNHDYYYDDNEKYKEIALNPSQL